MRAVVVIPAFNEEDTIGACLRSLAEQEGVSLDEFEVVLVLNALHRRHARRGAAAPRHRCG